MTYCLHACQIRLRSLNGLNLGSLTARPRRGHSLGAEAAEIAADKAEKSSRVPGIERLYESSSESNDSEVMVPATPPRPVGKTQLAGESRGATTITLALRTPERLRLGPDLTPRVSPPRDSEPCMAATSVDSAPEPRPGRRTPKTEAPGHNWVQRRSGGRGI
jgi:hypothetical protein